MTKRVFLQNEDKINILKKFSRNLSLVRLNCTSGFAALTLCEKNKILNLSEFRK